MQMLICLYFKLDVKFELPMYNGDLDAEKLDNWIKQLEVYCRVQGINDDPSRIQLATFACRGSSSDPAKSFQPISLRDEAIVLSYIATDSDGGIYWGAFSVQGGAQTPQGFRSRAVEVRSGFRQTVFPLQQPGRIDWSSFEIILTVEF
jgi:hypothetical protein